MSGSHRSGSHRAESGGYRTSGPGAGYGRGPGGSQPPGGSGPYRGGSGSHRIVHTRAPRRRLAVVLVGAVAGVAVCILAVFVVLGALDGRDDSGGITTSGSSTSESTEPGGERTVVPDACEMVSAQLASRLAPAADRTQSSTYQATDRQNQCVWGAYTGDRKRVLTVELRALAAGQGRTGTEVAGRTFEAERAADESGKGLLPVQKLSAKRALSGIGDGGYVVYAVDSAQNSGEATVNVRLGNVLVTVHYSGGNKDAALGPDPAIAGATAAAEETIKVLSTSK